MIRPSFEGGNRTPATTGRLLSVTTGSCHCHNGGPGLVSEGVGLGDCAWRLRHEARYGNASGSHPPAVLHSVRPMRRHIAGSRMVGACQRTLHSTCLVVRYLWIRVRDHGLPFLTTIVGRRDHRTLMPTRI